VKWPTVWLLIKDVLATGTGLVIIISQIFAPHPSDVLLVTAIALTTPSLASHAGTLLGAPSTAGHGQQESPSSSSPHGSPQSSSPGGSGDPRNGAAPG
jgi:hypothetical protein